MDTIVSITIFLLLLAGAYILVPKNKYKKAFIISGALAVLIRIAMVSYFYGTGTESFGTDGLLYHQEGIMVAGQLNEGVPFYLVDYSYTWYTVIVGIIYYLFGINRYIASYVNIALIFISALILLKIALKHKCQFKNAAFISLAFLYMPNLLLWSADSRKEAVLIFACFMCWYTVQNFIINVAETGRYDALSGMRILFTCFLIWFCTLIRIYMFAPLAAGIIAAQLWLYKKTKAHICILFAAVVLVSTILIFIFTVNPLMGEYHAIDFSDESGNVTEDIGNRMGTISSIASGRNILAAVANYLLLPYPGKINIADIQGVRVLELIVNIDMISWYICLILMLTGVYSCFKQRDSIYIGLFVYMSAYVFINALVVENVADTIMRYRSVIVGTSLLFIDWNVLKILFSHLRSFIKIKARDKKAGTVTSYSIRR